MISKAGFQYVTFFEVLPPKTEVLTEDTDTLSSMSKSAFTVNQPV